MTREEWAWGLKTGSGFLVLVGLFLGVTGLSRGDATHLVGAGVAFALSAAAAWGGSRLDP